MSHLLDADMQNTKRHYYHATSVSFVLVITQEKTIKMTADDGVGSGGLGGRHNH
jgi:hypothetical protein